jgi:3-phenylpropionate/trans-cinnamate dioxygenase ferredoxin subunit
MRAPYLVLALRVKLAKVADVKPGSGKAVQVNGRAIAVFNIKGEYFAVDDVCSHMGAPLANGFLAGKSITCEWHGASFDLETGEALNSPARGDIKPYKVIVNDEDLEIELEE